MKRRILIRLGLLAAVAVAGFLLLVWWAPPPNIVSIEQLNRIRAGMTEEEVLEVLGEPSTNEPELQKVKPKVPPFRGPAYFKEWRMEKAMGFRIGFDDNGKVMMIETFRRDESILDKIRRWIRL